MEINKKKDILIDSFNVIKDNINNDSSDYCRAIGDIIIEMFGIDYDTALSMWEYVLSHFHHYGEGYGNHTFHISLLPFENYLSRYGVKKTISLLKTNKLIKDCCLNRYCDVFFEALIAYDMLNELDEYLTYVDTNTKFQEDDCEPSMFYNLITNNEMSKACAELLLEHSKCLSREYQAIVRVNLLKHI